MHWTLIFSLLVCLSIVAKTYQFETSFKPQQDEKRGSNTPSAGSPYTRSSDQSQSTFSQVTGAVRDFKKNYDLMKEANHIGADKYFHAKANYEAAKRGPAGAKTAELLSNVREGIDIVKSTLTYGGPPFKTIVKDSQKDQEANRHGRNGGDPNFYRPPKLPLKY